MVIKGRQAGVEFQFHNGSIKGGDVCSIFRLDQPIHHLFHANSTMVRLKALLPCVAVCFNSTMVRLKVNSVVSTFQFHNGSIKGQSGCASDVEFHNAIKGWYVLMRFNSTMVRLKVAPTEFQFHDNVSIRFMVLPSVSIPQWFD